MIRINYGGMTGNNLFQYTVGRLLAEETGMALTCGSIAGFPELTQLAGDVFTDGMIDIDDNTFRCSTTIQAVAGQIKGHAVTIKGQFEMFSIFAPYLDRIRSWFSPCPAFLDQTAVHIRGTDHKKFGMLPESYYRQALGFAVNPVIYTDEPDWEFVRDFKLPVKHGSKMQDWCAIRSSRRIILSMSTFAWWAAILSQAELIVQPVPIRGFRSILTPTTVLHVPTWASIPCEPLWADG